ncbi:Uncharacterised protein [Campylobacter jejuni]|nr:Uncharacterised protein [Campylobacter jejuni]
MKIIKDTFPFSRRHPFVTLIIALILLLPLILYFSKFHHSLSIDPNKWAAFGSFFGGVYGPVIGLASVFVYLYTLLEIQSSNKKMLETSNKNNLINEVKWLCDSLRRYLDTSAIIKDKDYYYKWINKIIVSKLLGNPPANESEIRSASIKKFTDGEITIYENEYPLLRDILTRIHAIEDPQAKSISQAIIKSSLTNDERYWLECYMKRFWPEDMDYLSGWEDFSNIPKLLHDTLNDPKDFLPV